MAETPADVQAQREKDAGQGLDLTTAEAIRRVYETAFAQKMCTDERWKQWTAESTRMLQDVREASAEQLASQEFQHRLWEDNPVSSSGACSVSTQAVGQDRQLANWLAETAKGELPASGPERVEALEAIFDKLCKRVEGLTDRMPWVKILRVMATLFPADFSNVVTKHMLRRVAEAMFGKLSKEDRSSSVRLNAMVLGRLNEVLGTTDGSAKALCLRGDFVWCLWEALSGGVGGGADDALVFLPPERRSKGIGVMPDPLNMILDVVEFVSENRPTRAIAVDFIRERNPNIKRISASMYLSVIWNAFGMLRADGDILELTPEGREFLDSQDPDLLIRPMVTKSVGPDLVLWTLREGAVTQGKLVEHLQEHYRGWTTGFMPNTVLRYGRAFDLWRAGEDGRYILTERGDRWASRIPAKPGPVKITAPDDESDGDDEKGGTGDFVPPTLDDILASFRVSSLVFGDDLVVRLHAALHASESKHFVLLSGLSGTGKTQMALTYANAFHRVKPGVPNPFLLLVSVQPDWTDPTGLLGYVNPLGQEVSYVSTRCLRFLLSAHEKPKVPHFLCLDEMNLARVEYYFAPFLSAMETGGDIVLHQEKENIDEVPPSIPWPRNLFIFGTVNMDETTHAFSDKVLDRAFTVEFWDVDLDEFARRFAAAEANRSYPPELCDAVLGVLKEVAGILQVTHQHFGYRTAMEVLGFMRAAGAHLGREKALDHAVFMKILPKLRGQDTDAMRQVLEKMKQWADGRGFAASSAKLGSMVDELRATGTTRFWR